MAEEVLEEVPGTTGDPDEPLRQAAERQTLKAWATAVDLSVYRRIRRLAHDPEHVLLAKRLSQAGEHAILWLSIGALGIVVDRRRARRWARGAAVVGVAHACSSTIKVMIGRKRPEVEDLPHLMGTPTGLSFPSSHSASSFAAATVYGEMLPIVPLYALAGAMAFSRVYLGVHYPSDVAAGATLGIVVGGIARR